MAPLPIGLGATRVRSVVLLKTMSPLPLLMALKLPTAFNPAKLAPPTELVFNRPVVVMAPDEMEPLALNEIKPPTVSSLGRMMGADCVCAPEPSPAPVCMVMVPPPWVLMSKLGAEPLAPAPAIVKSMPRTVATSVNKLRVRSVRLESTGRVSKSLLKDEAV